jgi:hypothetical protein
MGARCKVVAPLAKLIDKVPLGSTRNHSGESSEKVKKVTGTITFIISSGRFLCHHPHTAPRLCPFAGLLVLFPNYAGLLVHSSSVSIVLRSSDGMIAIFSLNFKKKQ